MKNKNSRNSREFKGGAYSIVLCILVLAIAFVCNLFLNELPNNALQIDTTNKGIYTLSEQTIEIADSLEQEVTLYVVCQSGNEDDMLYKLIDRYDKLSKNITVKNVDPIYDPSFTARFTDSTVEDNSVIVESDKRYTIIYNKDIYEYTYDDYYNASFESFSGEAVITSAIDFVTTDNLPVLYKITGHNEIEFTSELKAGVERENIIYSELNLVSNDIPDDAACIMLYSPKKDLSAAETQKIRDYLADGGRMILITDYSDTKLPNVISLMNDYGTDLIDGIVVEGDSSKVISGYNHYILPNIDYHEITNPLIETSAVVLMPVSSGIAIDEYLRSTVTVSQLLYTSDSAYSKQAGSEMTTYVKEEGDIDGPFAVAVAIEEEYNGKDTKLVWFTNSGFLLNEVDSAVSGANFDIFLNSLSWMCERENGISIRAKALNMDYLTISSSNKLLISAVFVGIIPALIIALGVVVVVKRRKKS